MVLLILSMGTSDKIAFFQWLQVVTNMRALSIQRKLAVAIISGHLYAKFSVVTQCLSIEHPIALENCGLSFQKGFMLKVSSREYRPVATPLLLPLAIF